MVIIGNNIYCAEDCGGAIKGNKIDVYHESHEKAVEFGVQYADVFILM
jgi:3D (Asp-Asp-Asp) domain-containing protein